MISITVYSKQGIDLIMFHLEYESDIQLISSLEGKTIRNLEIRENVVIGELENE